MKLTKNEIEFLSKKIVKKNQIGLFSNMKSNLLGTEESTLIEKGVYEDGKLSHFANEALKVAAEPKICTRLILNDKSLLIEKYTYRLGDKVVLVENDGGELLFSIKEKFDDIIMELSEFTGMSNVKTSDIEVLLLVDEMIVLLAIVDIYRKNAMLTHWGMQAESAIKFENIREQLDNPVNNGLLKMIVNNYNYSIPKIEDTKSILDSLISKKVAAFTNGYVLTTEYAVFATNFLITKTIVMLETLNVNDKGGLTTAGALCVSAGVQDVLSFIFTEDQIEISSVTGSYLLKLIENFLSCPEITND